jgi:hypothetical protein
VQGVAPSGRRISGDITLTGAQLTAQSLRSPAPAHGPSPRSAAHATLGRDRGVALIDSMTAEQAFLFAARCGDVAGLAAFAADGGDVDVWDSVGRTATIHAARHRHPPALEW